MNIERIKLAIDTIRNTENKLEAIMLFEVFTEYLKVGARRFSRALDNLDDDEYKNNLIVALLK